MFQQLLEGSAVSGRSRWRLSAPLAVAAGLHGLAAALILGARLSTVDEPEPPIRLIFPEDHPVPAQLGDGMPARVRSPHPARGPVAPTARVPVPAVPTVQSDDRSTDATPSSDAIDAGGGETSDEGGGSGGDRTGTQGGTSSGPDGPGVDDGSKIHEVGGKVVAPQLILRIDPAYPEATRRFHAEGTVVLEAIISAFGTVEDVRVVKTANPLLDAAAVRAVERWRYQAATLNGRPVRVYLAVTVTFALR